VDPDQVTQSTGEDAADGPVAEPGEPEGTSAEAAGPTHAQRAPTTGRLRRERRRLWDERQETVYHLGGLALDLHSRAILGDALVARRAEVVHEIDARIASIDEQLADLDDRRRQRRVRVPPPAGYCLSCGAPYQTEAAFCFRCGARIHVPVDDADTQVIAMGEVAPIDEDSTMVIPATSDEDR
jgi:hypothetical protein